MSEVADNQALHGEAGDATATHGFESSPGNPGSASYGHLTFAPEGEESWVEPFDLTELAANVLRELDHEVRIDGDWIELPASGLYLLPQLIEFEILKDGNIHVATTVQCNHATMLPRGLFEYQYSTQETFDEAAIAGFSQWARTDLLVLLDATRDSAESCMEMRMEFAARDGQPARSRRVLFGPVAHYGRGPRAPATGESVNDATGNDGGDTAHDFCPCCLLTQSLDTFKPLLEDDALHGLRLFASRDQDGECQSDCRVNGEEWPQGLDALRVYAATWPGEHLEYRKQYVIVQSIID